MTTLVELTRRNLEDAQRATAIAAVLAAEELVRSSKSRRPSRAARDLASGYVGAQQREAEAWARYRSALEQSPQHSPIYL